MEYLHSDITQKVIKAYYNVYNKLGYGFLEKVYENAMVIELKSMGLKVEQQVKIKVFYNGQEVGYYIMDIVVENIVGVEIKACEALCVEHTYQLINYLKASQIEVGLLLNFGKDPEIKRKIFRNKLDTSF
ncbi:MAG: GxxExxY protein [Bacteroidetes bacterium]|nr:GxxExxY protein [Bacteroidota bacterium]